MESKIEKRREKEVDFGFVSLEKSSKILQNEPIDFTFFSRKIRIDASDVNK